MFSKKNRLKRKKDFERVYKHGRIFKQEFLLLKMVEGKNDSLRIGVVVAKKVSNKASERNLIKRRIREAIKEFLPQMRPSIDFVVIVQKGITKETSFWEIKKILQELLVKAAIIKKKEFTQ